MQYINQIYELYERNRTIVSVDSVKKIVSNIDICSILNEKNNEGVVKQKTIIEPKQRNVAAKSKKSKRTRDERSHAEEYSNTKLRSLKQPKKMDHMVKINRTLTFQGKRLCKYDYCIEFILHLFNVLH